MNDRVTERRRAAQLARHYRDEEGLSIAEIAHRLGRSQATQAQLRAGPPDDRLNPRGRILVA
jgi:transcriptional regulator with XRE-family HTH domain